MDPSSPKISGPTQVCKIVGISKRQLDYWILIGIIEPVIETRGAKNFKKFTEHHISILKEIKRLSDEGFMVHRALGRLKKEKPELFNHESNSGAANR